MSQSLSKSSSSYPVGYSRSEGWAHTTDRASLDWLVLIDRLTIPISRELSLILNNMGIANTSPSSLHPPPNQTYYFVLHIIAFDIMV